MSNVVLCFYDHNRFSGYLFCLPAFLFPSGNAASYGGRSASIQGRKGSGFGRSRAKARGRAVVQEHGAARASPPFGLPSLTRFLWPQTRPWIRPAPLTPHRTRGGGWLIPCCELPAHYPPEKPHGCATFPRDHQDSRRIRAISSRCCAMRRNSAPHVVTEPSAPETQNPPRRAGSVSRQSGEYQ